MKKNKSIHNEVKKWGKDKFQHFKLNTGTMKNNRKRDIKNERMRQKRTGEYYSKQFLDDFGYVPGKRDAKA